MDVTFRENEPYFNTTQSSLQGENNGREEMMPYCISLDDFTLKGNSGDLGNSEETLIKGETIAHSGDSGNSEQTPIERETIARLDRPNLKQYSWRNKEE